MKEQEAQTQGMNYLVSLPRRIVTVYVPLAAFLIVLFFGGLFAAKALRRADVDVTLIDARPDSQSFPSGHTTAAFAFATIVSAETAHWWPNSKWPIGTIMYGGAALTGVSRIYNEFHWASDVVAGAAIGTLTGIKVYRYTHSHPNNKVDKFFLRAGVSISPQSGWMPLVSVGPGQ